MTQPDRCPDCGASDHAGICPALPDPPGASTDPGSAPPCGWPGRTPTGDETTAPACLTPSTRRGAVRGSCSATPAPGESRAGRPAARCRRGRQSTRYRIVGEIARGGMGAILKGRDPDLGRDVAVKVLLEHHRDDPDMVRRFVEEAQIGGQLQHPGIVPVYELGAFADRRPFFAMKLVKGRTLAAAARRPRRPRRRPPAVPRRSSRPSPRRWPTPTPGA